MKKLFYLLFTLFSLVFIQTLSAAEKNASVDKLSLNERGDRASLSIRFKNYSTQKVTEMKKSVQADFEKLATLKLDAKQDAELVQNALKTLLIIDTTEVNGEPFDPARDTAQILTESYLKYKVIYDAAFDQLSKNNEYSESIKQLKEMWNNLSQGNG